MLTPAALLPPDEAQRLATLRHYNFRAVPPEEVFYDLLALAVGLFHHPIAFLALVDEEEVHFPVVQGAPPMGSVPRVQALCSSAILHPHAVAYDHLAGAALTGPDAPAIRAALAVGYGFYAAAPLRMPNGRHIGVLCLAGPEARSFTPDEAATLENLADVVSLAIAVRHLCLDTPELGSGHWQCVGEELRQQVLSIRADLDARAGPLLAGPAALHHVQQRLQALRVAL